jgi:hypothetical protein
VSAIVVVFVLRLKFSAVSGGAILDGSDEDARYSRTIFEQEGQVSCPGFI